MCHILVFIIDVLITSDKKCVCDRNLIQFKNKPYSSALCKEVDNCEPNRVYNEDATKSMISQLRRVTASELMVAQFRLHYLHHSTPEWNVIRQDGQFFAENAELKLLSGNFDTRPTVFIGCVSYEGNRYQPPSGRRTTPDNIKDVFRRVKSQDMDGFDEKSIIKEYFSVYKDNLNSEKFEDMSETEARNLAGYIFGQLETVTVSVEHASIFQKAGSTVRTADLTKFYIISIF